MQFAELRIFASWIKKTYYQMNLNVVIHSAIPDRQEVALRTMNDLKTFQSVHNWDYYNHLIHHLRLMAFLTIRLGQPSQNNKIAVIASYAIL